jgi:hypothetical protein
MKKNTNPDYLNEQYFEDWNSAPVADEPKTVDQLDGPLDGPENSSTGDY